MSSIIPYTCQDSKRRPRFSSKATNFTALDAMILLSCSFLLWSVFFFPLFPPDAMPEHSELIDGDPGLGVYWESKNSFIRNYARLYWRAGAVCVSCPVQLGGRASGMKPTSFKKSSKNGTGRSIGQAVACLVMAAAITIGGAGTTFLLASQPAGLTVEPAALQTEGRVTLPKFDHKSDRSEAKAESTQPEESVSSQEQAAASTPAAPATKAENTAAAPAESVAPAAEPAVQPEAVPADPMAGDASEIENENSFPHFLTETEALAAEDPMAAPEETAVLPETEETAPVAEEAPAASENGEDVLAEAQIKDINGTVLLTPEEIRDALDSGTLDEESIDPTCLTGENGLLQWLWELFFGKDEEETPQYSGWRTENGKTYYYDQNTHQPVTGIQSIDNKLYYFDASGVQQPATFGIDVSKYQSSIDWDKVKTAGVEFAIIRVGYRGYGSGALVQDPKFEEHFTNARNAGLRVGIYCFSQAVNENEAREEAQACVYVLNGRQLDYPIYFDTEASGAGNGRADGLGVEDRTKCAVAFCEEVKALGYKPGVYASTTWFRKRLDMSQLSNYYIWNAHYNVASSPIACNMWQGTCTARIPGYGGQIDVNISYMG